MYFVSNNKKESIINRIIVNIHIKCYYLSPNDEMVNMSDSEFKFYGFKSHLGFLFF
jgi:hypothetical protein